MSLELPACFRLMNRSCVCVTSTGQLGRTASNRALASVTSRPWRRPADTRVTVGAARRRGCAAMVRGSAPTPSRSRLATTDAPPTPAGPDHAGDDVSIEVSSTGASSTRTASVERRRAGSLSGAAEDEHVVERDIGTGSGMHRDVGHVTGALGEDHRLRPPVEARSVGDVDVGVPAGAGAAGCVDDRRRHRAHRRPRPRPDVHPNTDVVLAHRRCAGTDQPQRGAVPAEPHRRAAQHAIDAHGPARAASKADRHLGVRSNR